MKSFTDLKLSFQSKKKIITKWKVLYVAKQTLHQLKATWKLKFKLFWVKNKKQKQDKGMEPKTIIYSSQGKSSLFQHEYDLESSTNQGKDSF